jgi:hypothetical protein
MAEKRKKAYRRFEELTKRAMAPGSAEAQRDRDSTDGPPGDDGSGQESLTEPVLISLSPEVSRALELRADADRTTPSDVVEAALRRYLEIRRSRFT